VGSSTTEARVEKALEKQGRTIAWLARKVDLSVSYVWRILKGERPEPDGFRDKVADALDIPAEFLFDEISVTQDVAP